MTNRVCKISGCSLKLMVGRFLMLKEALQKPSLILRLENFRLLHRINYYTNDCSVYF